MAGSVNDGHASELKAGARLDHFTVQGKQRLAAREVWHVEHTEAPATTLLPEGSVFVAARLRLAAGAAGALSRYCGQDVSSACGHHRGRGGAGGRRVL